MADITAKIGQPISASVTETWKDMGDGTYARVIYAGGTSLATVTLPASAPGYVAGTVVAYGKTINVSTTPTITAGAYSAGDNIAGTLSWANAARTSGGALTIQTIMVSDLNKQNVDLDLIFFPASVTAVADNAAQDLSDSDLATALGHVHIYSTDYLSLNDSSMATVRNVGIAGTLAATTLYALFSTAGTPTYASTADLTIKLGIYQD